MDVQAGTKTVGRFLAGVTLAAAWLAVAGGAAAQVPDKFTNLQVLPKEIPRNELLVMMRGFAFALDVRCNHCHVGPPNLQGMDFATDEKATKRTARAMMKMVGEINGTFLKGIETGRPRRVEVQCQTCHRGLTVPRPIEDVVAHKVDTDGVAAAMAEYRGLRDEYYGSAAYDFSHKPLNTLAERLARRQKRDEALALLEMNIELHPENAYTRLVHGDLLHAMGRTQEAVAALRKAVELNPDSAWARNKLAEMEKAAEEAGDE